MTSSAVAEVDITNPLRLQPLWQPLQMRKRHGTDLFRTKKDIATVRTVFGIHSWKLIVAFCPINVRHMPFTSSRVLTQSRSRGGSMNKIRRLPFLILLALVCSSICWGQSIVLRRASKTSDLSAHPWSQRNHEPHQG